MENLIGRGSKILRLHVSSFVVIFAALHWFLGSTSAAPLLPDLVSYASVEDDYMYGGIFDTTSAPGRIYYRFSVAIANLGDGPFQVVYDTDLEAVTQDIYQEVFDSEGGVTSRLINTFVYEQPRIGALSFTSLARYRLLEVLPGEEIGPEVATYDKTSHAVVDSRAIDTTLPNAPPNKVYTSGFSNPLGISVGYADLYALGIPEQRIDLTGVPSGQYWLEVEIDPLGYVEEIDDSNNITRILVDLEIPTNGDFDADLTVAGADFLLWQQGGSPNSLAAEDLTSWTSKYSTNYPPLASSAAAVIPEPATAALLAISAVLACASVRMGR